MITALANFNAAIAWADLPLPKFLDDPWDKASATAPDPGTPWQPDRPLPQVPETPLELPENLKAKPLTLADLTDFALRNNPQTRGAWAAARANAAAVGVAQANYLPQLDGQFSIAKNRAASTSGIASPRLTRYGPSISLSYLLLDFGTRAGQLQTAEYNLLAANLNQNQVIQDVVLQVEQAYYQLLGLQALESANQQSLKNAEANLDAAKQRREAGLATIGDVYQAETAVAQAQLLLQQTQGQVASAQAQVTNAVGLTVTTAFMLEPWPAIAPIETISQSVEQLLAQAKTARPDLIAAQAKVQAAQGQVQAAAGQGRPSLSFTASSGQARFRELPSVAESSIGLTLRVPLFAGFRTAYSVSQAKAQVEQTEAQRDQLLSLVQLQVWQAYFNQQTAAATIKSASTLLRSATQAAEVAQARYRGGVGTILEVLSTQAAEANAHVQNIQAQLNWYVGLAQLGHAVGTLQTNGEYLGRQ